MLNTINDQRNANQTTNEITLHTHYEGHNKNDRYYKH